MIQAGAYVFPNRIFIGGSTKQFDADGNLLDAKLRERIKQQAAVFVRFAAALKHPSHEAG